MVRANEVYQKVLAFANKEQRGYLTPQEFNLFANQAQLEILDQYFYDINQFSRLHGNDTENSDMLDLLHEKLSVFRQVVRTTAPNGILNLPIDFYKLGSLYDSSGNEFEDTTYDRYQLLLKSPLTTPTTETPIHYQTNSGVQIFPVNTNAITLSYIKKPSIVKWGYAVINEKALYDPTNTNDFELHSLEEVELVYKILKYAGVAFRREDITQVGQGLETAKIQQEKQ